MIPRALLIAAGPLHGAESDGQSVNGLDYLWPPLLPLVDRPFLQHVIEQLAAIGVREIDVLVSNQPERVEACLGDGTRWGLRIRFHLVADPCRPFQALRYIYASESDDDNGEFVCIADAESLPFGFSISGEESIITGTNDKPIGWGRVSRERLAEMSPGDSINDLWSALEATGARSITAKILFARTCVDLMNSQRTVLTEACPELLRSGIEAEPGVTLSRNVSLHPSVCLIGPVFIAQDCRIEAGVELGPNVVIGPGCVIDIGATVADSLVVGGTYIGEGLEIRASIVDRNRLTSVLHGASVVITDSFLLGNMETEDASEWLRGLLSQSVGLVLLILLWPLLPLTALWLRLTRPGPVARSVTALALPLHRINDSPSHASGSEPTVTFWTFAAEGDNPVSGFPHLLLTLLPGLFAVVTGRMRLIGVTPRSLEAVSFLPPDWAALYRRAPAGLITEAGLLYGPAASLDEQYTSEAYYAVAGSVQHDAGIAALYIARLFVPARRREAPNTGVSLW